MADETTNVPAHRLLTQGAGFSRRALRKVKAYLYFEDGSRYDRRAQVPFGAAPRVFEFRGVRYEAALRMRPVVALHKPAGCVTSRSPRDGAGSVFDCLEALAEIDDLQPVGRLDLETEGLLLFTTDGELLHRLTHPRWRIPRRYLAAVDGAPAPEALEALRAGALVLRDEHQPRPERLAPIDADPLLDALEVSAAGWWEVVLDEGKYHEVRRMFAAAGAEVRRLVRAEHAGCALLAPDAAGWLPPAEARLLDEAATCALYARVDLTPARDWLDVAPLHAVEDDERWSARHAAREAAS